MIDRVERVRRNYDASIPLDPIVATVMCQNKPQHANTPAVGILRLTNNGILRLTNKETWHTPTNAPLDNPRELPVCEECIQEKSVFTQWEPVRW